MPFSSLLLCSVKSLSVTEEVINFMGSFFRQRLRFLRFERPVIILSLSWLAGLIAGIFCAVHADEPYFALMRMAAGSRVSIVGLVASVLLPFLIAAFAVYISTPQLLYPLCFAKALLFSFGACGVYIAFGSAGWLAQFLLQFSDCLLLPVFCWFCIRHISGKGQALAKELAMCAAAVGLIGSIDYCVVSPFLAMLIDI